MQHDRPGKTVIVFPDIYIYIYPQSVVPLILMHTCDLIRACTYIRYFHGVILTPKLKLKNRFKIIRFLELNITSFLELNLWS